MAKLCRKLRGGGSVFFWDTIYILVHSAKLSFEAVSNNSSLIFNNRLVDYTIYIYSINRLKWLLFSDGCLGGAAVRRRTRDRKVASQLGQLSLPSLCGR